MQRDYYLKPFEASGDKSNSSLYITYVGGKYIYQWVIVTH